jgi:diguanylate cyclase (GGDEF)-like protein
MDGPLLHPEWLAAIVDATTDCIVTAEVEGRIVCANAAARALLGLSSSDDLGNRYVNVYDVYSADARRVLGDVVMPELVRSGKWAGVLPIRMPGRGVHDLDHVLIAHSVDATGGVGRFSVIVRDLTDQASRPSGTAAVGRDALTGLDGRELFVDRLNHCMLRSARNSKAFAVLFCDLDGFKLVNDAFGHEAGDAVLVEVASRLRRLVRAYDSVARFGGDEFVVLLEEVPDAPTVVSIADRIVSALAEPIPLAEGEATIGASIGVAVSIGVGHSPDALIARADAAMYEAKERGKGRVELFDTDLDHRITEQRELGNDLRSALNQHELELALQLCYRPVVSLVSGDVTSLEASVQWNHPTRGPLAADAFIPIASAIGMIEHIDQWAVATAAKDIATLLPHRRELVAWVTLSGRLLIHRDGAPRILSILATTDAAAHSIGIEIDEDAVVRNFSETVAALRELHHAGVRIALDNFSGQLTVAQLQTLQPKTVKLDRGFLMRLGADVESSKAVRSLIGMIRPLGITVVAKGVDTREQLAAVISLNLDEAQGTIVGLPTSAANLTFQRRTLDITPTESASTQKVGTATS